MPLLESREPLHARDIPYGTLHRASYCYSCSLRETVMGTTVQSPVHLASLAAGVANLLLAELEARCALFSFSFVRQERAKSVACHLNFQFQPIGQPAALMFGQMSEPSDAERRGSVDL